MKKIVSKAVTVVGTLFIVALLLLLLVPRILGWSSFGVLTGSMRPNISVGSLVFVQPVTFEELEAGDVITFAASMGDIVTHRIIEIDAQDRTAITQGDANNTPDARPVEEENIVGRVVFWIPLLGYLSVSLRGARGGIVVGILVAAIIVIFVFPMIFKDHKDGDKDGKKSDKGSEAKKKSNTSVS